MSWLEHPGNRCRQRELERDDARCVVEYGFRRQRAVDALGKLRRLGERNDCGSICRAEGGSHREAQRNRDVGKHEMKSKPHEHHQDEDEPDRERKHHSLVLPQRRLIQLLALVEEKWRYEQQHEQLGVRFYDRRYRKRQRHHEADCYLHERRRDMWKHPVQKRRYQHRYDQYEKQL